MTTETETETENTADTIAAENELAYEGDVYAMSWGGTFFHLDRDDRENGYIEAVRIYPMGGRRW